MSASSGGPLLELYPYKCTSGGPLLELYPYECFFCLCRPAPKPLLAITVVMDSRMEGW